MRIIVTMKQVPDPEGPRDCFVIDPETNQVKPKGIPPVLSLFDENALEAALRLKDTLDEEVRVTVLSVGKRVADAVMLKALASGADDLIKVEDPSLDPGQLDSHATARVLTSAIQKAAPFDLVLVGRQAADWNAGQVGTGIAGELGLPLVTLARTLRVEAGALVVERVLSRGHEIVQTALPAVVMASNEVGELRYPTMKARRDAKKKPITAWSLPELGSDGPPANRVFVRRLYAPTVERDCCTLIQGATPAEAGRNLAERLRQEKAV